ncbi:hypothetical protein [Micromonospora sp. NPDC005173]|uniref:hypothetical protein n=1 Tax=Micromonospora sp. NPDC005173 TaxID=3157165 RepID=UPI0033A940A5
MSHLGHLNPEGVVAAGRGPPRHPPALGRFLSLIVLTAFAEINGARLFGKAGTSTRAYVRSPDEFRRQIASMMQLGLPSGRDGQSRVEPGDLDGRH